MSVYLCVGVVRLCARLQHVSVCVCVSVCIYQVGPSISWGLYQCCEARGPIDEAPCFSETLPQATHPPSVDSKMNSKHRNHTSVYVRAEHSKESEH